MGILSTTKSIAKSVLGEVKYFFRFNARYIVGAANVLLPYGMYAAGQMRYEANGQVGTGIELVIPAAVMFGLYCAKEAINRHNIGNTVPVPRMRFTEVGEYGEVSIENGRLQELILYMADLEDWLHRKGML